MHLTNVAIQKQAKGYNEGGCKWLLNDLRMYMVSKHGEEVVDECFTAIHKLILRTLQSVQKIMINDKHCFEMYLPN